jgi:hypothetical protein
MQEVARHAVRDYIERTSTRDLDDLLYVAQRVRPQVIDWEGRERWSPRSYARC